MLKRCIFLLFLILTPSITAITVDKTLKVNETAAVNGKNFFLERVGLDYSAIVIVDGVKGIIPFRVNATKSINGAILLNKNVTYVDDKDAWATLQISVEYTCGDKLCNETQGENSAGCCTDCGCKNGYECGNNVCQLRECVINADCDDKDPCTQDKCIGVPRKCEYKKIPDCSNETAQNITVNETKPINETVENRTKEISCKPGSCIVNSTCLDIGSIMENEFCSSGTWLERKKDSKKCSNDYECLNNLCLENVCSSKVTKKNSLFFGAITAILTLIFGLIVYKKYFIS